MLRNLEVPAEEANYYREINHSQMPLRSTSKTKDSCHHEQYEMHALLGVPTSNKELFRKPRTEILRGQHGMRFTQKIN